MVRKIFLRILLITTFFITSCGKKPDDGHIHSYSAKWTYDTKYHWHNAICEHKDLAIDNAMHTFDNGTIVDSTFEEDGYITYSCTVCNFQKQEIIPMKEHSYSTEYSFDDEYHWNSCTDYGYEHLKLNQVKHTDSNETIIKPVTSNETGLAQYVCSVCQHTYQKVLLIEIQVISVPTVDNQEIYVGQTLKDVKFNGGNANVIGTFEWTNPNEKLTESKEYSISFIPTDSDKYATVESKIYLEVTQLTVCISIGSNGSANYEGTINVDYQSDLKIEFYPLSGYQVSSLIVDDVSVEPSRIYTYANITSNHVLIVDFEEIPSNGNSAYQIEFISGTGNAYSITGDTITFSNITEDSVYAISGILDGNIIIDVSDNYKFDLELCGFTLTSTNTNPIMILSGDEVSITAKKGYQNFIYDNRSLVDESDETLYSAAIYSFVDLEICGKGELEIISQNNKGIHTKDDLQVKNLTLKINCSDNCLKGNDSVEIENATTTLIAFSGDCIKTSNSHINATTLNQKGTVSINGGTHYLYAACDGIDSAYDIVIDNEATVLNIKTDQYSEYSEEVSTVTNNTYYLRYSKNTYSYSIKYYNTDSDYKWVNATYYDSVSKNGRNYYFYSFEKLSDYNKIIIYMYNQNQAQGQSSSYYAASSYMSINENYDTLELSYRGNSLSVNWNLYSSSSSSNGGMGGGFESGNTDKSEYSTKGLKAANEITINNGIIDIQSRDDSIHANIDSTLENGMTPVGNVTINNGIITIYSCDDGIHADGNLIINDGIINITNSYEGIEGTFITIGGGNLSIISSDDGMNGKSTSGQSIKICDGNVYIFAKGDGIDSNSTSSYNGILFSGGNAVIICNSNGNSAIDSERGYSYAGGNVVAITSSGGMSNETTNCSSFTSVGTSQSKSLSTGTYLVVSIGSNVKTIIKMPCSLSAIVVYLGSNSASYVINTSNTYTLDSNGVYWN